MTGRQVRRRAREEVTRLRCCRPIRTYGADDGPGRLAASVLLIVLFMLYFCPSSDPSARHLLLPLYADGSLPLWPVVWPVGPSSFSETRQFGSWGWTVQHLGPNCLLDTSVLVPKCLDTSDPSEQCWSVSGPKCPVTLRPCNVQFCRYAWHWCALSFALFVCCIVSDVWSLWHNFITSVHLFEWCLD